jgi:hypothetical protein
MHFEAGAVGMRLTDSPAITRGSVVPYLFDVTTADLKPPLSFYEAKVADQQGTLAVVKAINTLLPDPLAESALDDAYRVWWPELQASFDDARNAHVNVQPKPMRSDREILEEILAIVRGSARSAEPTAMERDLIALLNSLLVPIESPDQDVATWARIRLMKSWHEADRERQLGSTDPLGSTMARRVQLLVGSLRKLSPERRWIESPFDPEADEPAEIFYAGDPLPDDQLRGMQAIASRYGLTVRFTHVPDE